MPLAEEVRRGISEMGITNAPLPDPSLFRVLHEETCTLMAAARRDSHFLPDRESLRPEDLASAPLAVSRSTEEAVKQFFGEKGLRAPILFAVDARSSALAMAEAGLAAAVITRAPWEKGEEDMVLTPLDSPSSRQSITFFCLKDHHLSKGMERFLACLEKELDTPVA